ncbi:hypothetical protein ACIBHX_13175 [Nonomuraea sp. NPDC050536]|uniref:hypothetical protein n=1 Tax=Nonomuraea sp. NPDC050536 TaxID=3364366 RepID=UPI0037CAEE08
MATSQNLDRAAWLAAMKSDGSRGDVQDGRDRGGGVDRLHRALPSSMFLMMETLRSIQSDGNSIVA